MSSYSELIKNFEKIRAYMREFYVYGFKSREDYNAKSARSYDDERRRIDSWLGEHMSFVRSAEGKNVFISIDSRSTVHNPLYRAWKAKSFTDKDITLHFIIFDILSTPEIALPLSAIIEKIDKEYLSAFPSPMMFDESTVRKKLKEYCDIGIIEAQKLGKRTLYRRAESIDISDAASALSFYSEVAPCSVIGSYLLDKNDKGTEPFSFKHHYITGAIDSGVLASLFSAMQKKCSITVSNANRQASEPVDLTIITLRVFISVQNGRQHLLAYHPTFRRIRSFRIDYLSSVREGEPYERFDELRGELDRMQGKMWGVSTGRARLGKESIEHVEFTVRVERGEEYIVRRLMRERRIGRVEKLDSNTYKFTAEVYDTSEMLPWIRTFICRIVQMNFTNRAAENRFKDDLLEMYRIYGISEEGEA